MDLSAVLGNANSRLLLRFSPSSSSSLYHSCCRGSISSPLSSHDLQLPIGSNARKPSDAGFSFRRSMPTFTRTVIRMYAKGTIAAFISIRSMKLMMRQVRPPLFDCFSNSSLRACYRQVGRSVCTASGQYYFRRLQLGTRYAQIQIVSALRAGERERAFKMLLNLGNANGSLRPDDFSFVLDYCAKTPDPLFVMETWRIMEERAIAIDMRCSRSIVQAFSKGGYLKEAFNWLAFVGEHDFGGSVLPLYNIFLSECASRKSFNDAERCMELMERQLVGKSEITYWELLKFAVSQKNLSAVHDIWKECTKYYSPSIITLRKFILSFTRLNALESAYAVLKHMVALATRESASLRTSSKARYQSSWLDIPIPPCSEVPHEIFGSKGMQCLPNILLDGIMETEYSLERSCMDQFNKEKQSLHNVDEALLDRFNLDPSHMPSTVENIICNEVKRDKINSNVFSSSAGASGNDYQNLEQDDFTEMNLQNTKDQGLGFGVCKARISPPVKRILRWSFNNVIHACARTKNYKLAKQLLMQMHDLGLEPSGDTYDGFVKAVVYEKGVNYGMKVIESMEKRNIKPYNDTLAVLSTGYSKNLELDLAEGLLEKISDGLPKYIHPFNAILSACDVMDQPERAVRLLAKMKHLKIKSNIRTYELLFSLFGNVNVPYEKGSILSHVDVSKRINIIEKDMIRNGVQHSYTCMMNLIRAFGAEGMIRDMLRCLKRAESTLWNIDSYRRADMYNIVLHALVKAKESSAAIELFKNMRLSGVPANVATYNMIIECCSILACFRSASALLSIMLRDGFVPETLTYTALVKVLLANDDFDRTVSLLDQASSEGIQLDIQLFNIVLKQAFIKGRMDIIEFIAELIHTSKIQPNPSTCWYTFSTYVERGFYSTAMEALQVLSLRMISVEDDILQEYKAAYEDLLNSELPDVESKIVEIFKEHQEFSATALLSLRWCAINGLLISWSPNESIWTKRLSSSSYASRRRAI